MAVLPPFQGRQTEQNSRLRLSLRWHHYLNRRFLGLLQFVLPAACAGCKAPGSPFCDQCYTRLRWIEPPLCSGCGQPISVDGQLCRTCTTSAEDSCYTVAVVQFAEPIRPAIYALKYGRERGVAKALAKIMVRGWQAWAQPVDMVIPIPLHPERYRWRGFNQSAEIAAYFTQAAGIALSTDALYRTVQTKSQVGLKRSARQQNVQNAFEANPAIVKRKRVLLIDDVCTTGATINSAAKALRHAGAATVSAYTLARAQSYREHNYLNLTH